MSEAKPAAPADWARAVIWLIVRVATYAALIAGGVVFLSRLRVVILFLLIAGTLAYVMRPVAGWMARRNIGVLPWWSPHLRRVFTTFYVLVLLFAGGWLLARVTTGPFVREIQNVTDNWGTHRPDDLKDRLDETQRAVIAWYGKTIPPEWRQRLEQQASPSTLLAKAQGSVAAWAGEAVRSTATVVHYLVEIVLLPVMAFYLALDSKRIKHEFVGALPRRRRREVLRVIHRFNEIMYSYVVGQAILCALAGVIVGLGLAVLGVRYPLMLGLLAGVTRAIPIIGPIIGGIPIVALVFATKGIGVAVAVLIFFSLLHFAESKFIMPLLIGDRMNLHAAVVIVVLLIGQEFGGLTGMFFAPPVASLARYVVRRYWILRQTA